MICENFFSSACPVAPTTPLNLTDWFAKPKPDPLPAPKVPSGERLKVLHLSDLHLDPSSCIISLKVRYLIVNHLAVFAQFYQGMQLVPKRTVHPAFAAVRIITTKQAPMLVSWLLLAMDLSYGQSNNRLIREEFVVDAKC